MDLVYPDGATPLDPDEKEGLKLPHVTTREELNRWEQENIADALDWLERRRNKEILNEQFLRRLHEKMLGKVWEWAGQYRRTNKNIGVDWPQIPMRTRDLIENVRYWVENKTFPEDEIAARYHHRLVWIHLFPNGNGRHARMTADYMLENVCEREPFTWGSGNLTDEGDVRSDYIDSLRAADQGDYEPLLKFVRT